MNIRDMTEAEVDSVVNLGQCPHCKSEDWYAGPCGGSAQNHECTKCGLKINIAPPMQWGQILSTPEGYVPPVMGIKRKIEKFFRRFL